MSRNFWVVGLKCELMGLCKEICGKEFERALNSSELKIRILPHSKHRTSSLQMPRGHQVQAVWEKEKRKLFSQPAWTSRISITGLPRVTLENVMCVLFQERPSRSFYIFEDSEAGLCVHFASPYMYSIFNVFKGDFWDFRYALRLVTLHERVNQFYCAD